MSEARKETLQESSTLEGGFESVWKFPLPLAQGPDYMVPMPHGAKVLTAQEQHGTPTLWAVVKPHEDTTELRRFKIVGTGFGEVYSNDHYIATVQIGNFVWHVFEVTP